MAGLSITYHKKAQNTERKGEKESSKEEWKTGERAAEGRVAACPWPASAASPDLHACPHAHPQPRPCAPWPDLAQEELFLHTLIQQVNKEGHLRIFTNGTAKGSS